MEKEILNKLTTIEKDIKKIVSIKAEAFLCPADAPDANKNTKK